MVLKGSLREFILADIFNLLTTQKITGKLLLSTGENEGVIIFKDGIITAAFKEDENLVAKLFNLLVNGYNHREEVIKGLFASFENNINGLLNEILHLNLLTKDRLESFSASVIEDITCSFFLWKKGTYYFSSTLSVEDMSPTCVAIPVESMVMEASRRVDEWARMQQQILDYTVFVQIEKYDESAPVADPLDQPEEHLLGRINGTATVDTIIRTSCYTEYKVFEILNTLLQSKRIAPLSMRISQSVAAALEKKGLEGKKLFRPIPAIIAIACTAGIAIALYLFGHVLINNTLLSGLAKIEQHKKLELPLAQTVQKASIATLQYHALYGDRAATLGDLTENFLLSNADVKPLESPKVIKILSLTRKNAILYQIK